ncbi:hypothetical protein OG723_44595 (plasmid) [Streptomyces sp. NBC_01278]|uniref:hypothetical protein n=1 Tax=Streptomyces sp. NBC_01278 TaxID=2903809 RepID=UPI002E35D416|nr:hypothetical protein [Streptomyces sp. NBC_01278]
MIKGWGAAASITFAVVAAVTVSGCGGEADAEAKAAPTSSAASIGAATTGFKDAVTKFDVSDGCPKEAGACWDKMLAVMEPARELREAMNANQAGPAFWTEAYALIDKMERGVAVGEDKVSNRPDVLGSAHELSRWLDAHPAQ